MTVFGQNRSGIVGIALVTKLGDSEIQVLIHNDGEQLGRFPATGHAEDLTVGVFIEKVGCNEDDGKDE